MAMTSLPEPVSPFSRSGAASPEWMEFEPMSKINRTAALTALALAAIPAALLAQPASGPQASVTKAAAQARAAEMFAKMDANKDGKLDKADRAARQGEMFARLDTDKDGKLSQQEFAAGRPKHEGMEGGPEGRPPMAGKMGRRGPGGGMMGMMARMADTNKDGAISRDEFLAAQAKHFEMMDANKDGTVTIEERQAARAKMRDHMKAMHGAGEKAGHEGHEGH